MGPYNNPQETYNYYYLPYCKRFPRVKAEHSWGGLGEVLQGNELINSQLDIKFKGEPGKECKHIQDAHATPALALRSARVRGVLQGPGP